MQCSKLATVRQLCLLAAFTRGWGCHPFFYGAPSVVRAGSRVEKLRSNVPTISGPVALDHICLRRASSPSVQGLGAGIPSALLFLSERPRIRGCRSHCRGGRGHRRLPKLSISNTMRVGRTAWRMPLPSAHAPAAPLGSAFGRQRIVPRPRDGRNRFRRRLSSAVARRCAALSIAPTAIEKRTKTDC